MTSARRWCFAQPFALEVSGSTAARMAPHPSTPASLRRPVLLSGSADNRADEVGNEAGIAECLLGIVGGIQALGRRPVSSLP